MRNTRKFPLYGVRITDTDYFERVEKMLLSLFKTRECVKINVQAGRIESHKHSLQIVRKTFQEMAEEL